MAVQLKILLAEDEQIERSALKFIISNYIPCFEIVADAANGIELLELAKQHEPDVIVADIKMPGIDGISAISQIKNIFPDIEFLVISAHADFEFAQAAILLGAAGYLTKPIKNTQLISTLNTLYDKIIDNRLKKTQNEKINMFKPQMENNILHAIASMRVNSAVSDQFDQFWDINTGQYFCILAAQNSGCLMDFNKKEMFMDHLRESLRIICPEFVMGFINEDILILLPYHLNREKYEPDVYQEEIADYLKACFYDANFKADILISKIVSNLHSLAVEYRKFREQVFLGNNSGRSKIQNKVSELYARVLSLCGKITDGDTKLSIEEMNKVMLCIQTEICSNPGEEKKYLKDIYTILKGFIFSKKDAYNSFNDFFCGLQIRIENIQDSEQLFDEILNMVVNIAGYYEKKNLHNIDSKINSITEYINKNYTIDNSLESLAKQYSLNASYLSKVFKQRYGKNFIDFITELRIEQAKKLLTTTDKSIKEITYEVGYNSQTYFCKVFKKIVGINASEYKQEFNPV
jgi:two-component system response regulator YesN